MSDVIIIGGGPAGSVLGCYLFMAGIDNMIIESANHPRDHVGESLVTSTMIVLKEIGMLGTMEEMEFVRKLGASWHAPMGREASHNELSIRFRQFPQEGIEQDYTYHVDRGKFDHLLLKRAEALGSKVYQGVHAKQVLFEDGHAAGVRVAIGGQEVDLKCKVVSCRCEWAPDLARAAA